MDLRRLLAGLVLVLAGASPLAAEFTPPPPRPLPPSRGEARVIVQFKPGAAVFRRLSLAPAARNLAAEAQALDQRAAQLGIRTGLVLAAGAGISDRSQVMVARGIDSAALAARLAQDPEVEFAVPDQRMRRARVPNDPLYLSGGAAGPASGQWYLRPPTEEVRSAIDAQTAWDMSRGGSTVVAVLDTGARYDHADLAGKLLPGRDFITDPQVANDGDGRDADASDPGDWVTAAEIATPKFADCEPSPDSSWHGTMVAGLVAAAADNGVGMAGTGWNIRVLPVRVLGKCFGSSSDIVAAMRWAAGIAVPNVPDNPTPAKVVNLSLGGEGACSAEYQSAISELNARNVIVVAAAGNSAGRAVSRPANCPGAIGVAALRHIGTKVGFSDLGPEITIAAPGGNCVNLSGACLYPILTTSNAGTTTPAAGSSIYTDASNVSVGTSFAAPLVAGTVGLMAWARPALTPAEARTILQSTARPFPSSGVPDDPDTGPVPTCQAPGPVDQLQCYCTTSTCGAGMLNAAAAVASVSALSARIIVRTSSPQAGSPVTLSGDDSVVASGRSLTAHQWTLVDGGGIVTGFTDPTSLSTAVLPSSPGSFTVRLTVTDDQGLSSAAETTVTVAATAQPSAPAPSGDGGGGAMDAAAVLMLAAVIVLLRRKRR